MPGMREKGRPRSHEALANLAKRQHGVVSIRQLTGPLGYSHSAIDRAKSAGRLHRLHRGVYAVGHTRLTQQGRCLGAVLACGRGALLSHDSAAWLWGISTKSPAPYAVATPVRRKPRPPIVLHYAGNLAPEDRALREGIPVTSVARTFLDVAATARTRRLQRMLERSEELRLFDLAQVESVLERNKGHHGAGPLRRALVLYKPAPFTVFPVRSPASTRRAMSSTSTGPSSASPWNSTPTRRMAPARPSSATACARRS
jgi:predicted transcriptional regulator of viral defense system